MNVAPPSSQKADARPISFFLAGGGSPASVDLVIRPEDLSRSDPSRLSVQQTLGGAWADNFGPGIAQIQISGHTGWRRTPGDSGDGMDRFQRLKDSVFDEWHARRQRAVQAGQDPDLVQLVFSDALDSFAVVVAPMSFTLRRSKSRPLLCQYQINLTVLQQSIGSPLLGGPLSSLGALADVTQSLGLDSLVDSVNRITRYLNDVQNFIERTIAAPVRAFMNQTARLYTAVRRAIQAADGIAGSLINIAQMTARAGLNLFRTLAAVANIPSLARQRLMEVAGAYSNVFCLLRNALRGQTFFPDYSSLFGSSNCSSTSGGRPVSRFADQNPFFSVAPTQRPLPVSVSTAAQGGLRTMSNSDPVLRPMSMPTLSAAVTDVASGLVVA